ncbi:hypothetical protein QFC19_009124 [Naganishia cerealis]|uniref:Uncharacterized protein n=1 Tax=Naganishia cerealis TaxID=610337 RepID=A0ACC2UWU4_9TREE|nr:hypothetical protein QFC19_009124 [Naganishia cerealis]
MSNKHSPAAPMSKQQCCSTSGNCPCASTSRGQHVHPAATSAGETVRLPSKSKTNYTSASEGVWKVSPPTDERTALVASSHQNGQDYGVRSSGASSPAPSIYDKCDAGPNSQCCRDALPEERSLISHDIVRDIIIGLSDGLTVPFALTAGLSSLGSSKLVYMGGLAEIVGGAFSMGVGYFGEGMEEVPQSRLFASAFTIGASYALGGLVPLLPYFFIDKAFTALYWSIGITSIILLLFGGLKSWFTGAALGPGGVIYGALTTLLVVAAAGAASFGIVRVLEMN